MVESFRVINQEFAQFCCIIRVSLSLSYPWLKHVKHTVHGYPLKIDTKNHKNTTFYKHEFTAIDLHTNTHTHAFSSTDRTSREVFPKASRARDAYKTLYAPFPAAFKQQQQRQR